MGEPLSVFLRLDDGYKHLTMAVEGGESKKLYSPKPARTAAREEEAKDEGGRKECKVLATAARLRTKDRKEGKRT
jgi:hypothetical protein